MLNLYSFQLIDKNLFLKFYEEIKSALPKVVQEKVAAFRFPNDKQRSLIGDLMVRHYYATKFNVSIQEIDFEYNEHDKPFLKNDPSAFFNISHSGVYVVAAFSDKPVGVDVEIMKKDRRNIAKRYFTSLEIEDMNKAGSEEAQIKYFYQLWTLKESYMKAIGDGLTMSLSSFSFAKNANGFYLSKSQYGAEWFFHSQQWNRDAYLSICSKEKENLKETKIGIDYIKGLFQLKK